MAKMYRQGDVLLIQVTTLPSSAVPEAPEPRVVLAYGEVTGHAHALEPALATLYAVNDDRYLVTKPGATLRHEEHAEIPLEPGVYKVVRQVEYTPQEIRRVSD